MNLTVLSFIIALCSSIFIAMLCAYSTENENRIEKNLKDKKDEKN